MVWLASLDTGPSSHPVWSLHSPSRGRQGAEFQALGSGGLWAKWKRRQGSAGQWQRNVGAFTLAAEFHFWNTPVLSFLGQGQGGGRSGVLIGEAVPQDPRRERGRGGARAGGRCSRDPGSFGLWGPLCLAHFSLARAPRGWHCGPPGCVGPVRPAAVPGRAASGAPSLAARCALRPSRRRRVLPLSPRSSRASQRNRGEGESERGRRERREGERGGREGKRASERAREREEAVAREERVRSAERGCS